MRDWHKQLLVQFVSTEIWTKMCKLNSFVGILFLIGFEWGFVVMAQIKISHSN